jgi:hypothetical protein
MSVCWQDHKYSGDDQRVKKGKEIVAIARTREMARRIANALNLWQKTKLKEKAEVNGNVR